MKTPAPQVMSIPPMCSLTGCYKSATVAGLDVRAHMVRGCNHKHLTLAKSVRARIYERGK